VFQLAVGEMREQESKAGFYVKVSIASISDISVLICSEKHYIALVVHCT